MLLEAIGMPFIFRWAEGEAQLTPGSVVNIPDAPAMRLLEKAPGRVRAVEQPESPGAEEEDALTPPLKAGWLIAYQSRTRVWYTPPEKPDKGQWVYPLLGGCNDREHGTVQVCEWNGTSWTVRLTDGQCLPLCTIVSVGQTDATGKVVAAWTVRAHGYDGEAGDA